MSGHFHVRLLHMSLTALTTAPPYSSAKRPFSRRAWSTPATSSRPLVGLVAGVPKPTRAEPTQTPSIGYKKEEQENEDQEITCRLTRKFSRQMQPLALVPVSTVPPRHSACGAADRH